MITNILTYLDQNAIRFADKVAIADDRNSLTFAQWKQQAEAIGSVLGETINKQMRRPVLVFIDRRIEGLVGFMGVVESGNFYVPIDCKMPDQRVKLIHDVLNPVAAITTTTADEKILDLIDFQGIRIQYTEAIKHDINKEYLDEIRSKVIDTDPLYSIFTSGSTGVPKGCLLYTSPSPRD